MIMTGLIIFVLGALISFMLLFFSDYRQQFSKFFSVFPLPLMIIGLLIMCVDAFFYYFS